MDFIINILICLYLIENIFIYDYSIFDKVLHFYKRNKLEKKFQMIFTFLLIISFFIFNCLYVIIFNIK